MPIWWVRRRFIANSGKKDVDFSEFGHVFWDLCHLVGERVSWRDRDEKVCPAERRLERSMFRDRRIFWDKLFAGDDIFGGMKPGMELNRSCSSLYL